MIQLKRYLIAHILMLLLISCSKVDSPFKKKKVYKGVAEFSELIIDNNGMRSNQKSIPVEVTVTVKGENLVLTSSQPSYIQKQSALAHDKPFTGFYYFHLNRPIIYADFSDDGETLTYLHSLNSPTSSDHWTVEFVGKLK